MSLKSKLANVLEYTGRLGNDYIDLPVYYEQYGDSTQLLFLRARFYNPADGRFQSRDTWNGDYNRPLSLNRWMYVEGNPVNLTDPSGYYGEMPDWCQMMPTKGLYEYCILQKYDLEPISISEMGQYVTGSPGCYSGPTEYRAPGYLEGVEAHKLGLLPGVGVTGGLEIVYDLATMQRSGFSFIGGTVSDGIVGVGLGLYVGKVMGFRTDTSIIDGYRGVSFSGQVGVSFDIGIGAAFGRGGFFSEGDPRLRGKTLYLAGGVSGDWIEGVDLSVSWVTYKPNTTVVSYDANKDGFVERKAQIYSDISLGIGSPLQGVDLFSPGTSISRLYGRLLAEKYIAAYEALRKK